MKKKLGLWTMMLAALALMAGLGGCSSNDAGLTGPNLPADGKGAGTPGAQTNNGADIVDTAIGAGSFTTLVAAVQAAGLEGALRGEGPFTVFAPTDDAFAALPEGFVSQLLQPRNQGKLQELLLYHVVSGRVLKGDLSFYQRVPTLQGSQVTIVKWFGNVWVNTSKVTAADVLATNGVIHVIDRVLIPRGFTLSSKAGTFTADGIEKAMPLADDAELPPTEFPAEYQDQAL